MLNNKKQYFSGFADALLTLGLLSQVQLETLVEDTNIKVFNMSLKDRREVLDIKADPSMFDSPAWIRQGKEICFWLPKKTYKLILLVTVLPPNSRTLDLNKC